MTPQSNQTVRQMAIEHPSTVRVFEKLGIDYCCGGRKSIEEACRSANVPLENALELLSACEDEPKTGSEDWARAELDAVITQIIEKHHAYVRTETPRIVGLLSKLAERHGFLHPELKSIREIFTALSEELAAHMMKEEQILFPYIAALARAERENRPAPQACFDSVEMPISRMLADHDDAGALLAQMRSLSGGYTAPAGSCPTYVGTYHALEEFERDLHHHVHLENNILFPRTVELERRLEVGVRV
jgi:regulator of cell morphogenesis and NO signaling